MKKEVKRPHPQSGESIFVSCHRTRLAPESETPAYAGTLSADQEHELPADVALLAHPVSLGNFGERKGLRDREGEAPGLDQLADLYEHVTYIGSEPETGAQHVARWPPGQEYIRPQLTPTSLGQPQAVSRLLTADS